MKKIWIIYIGVILTLCCVFATPKSVMLGQTKKTSRLVESFFEDDKLELIISNVTNSVEKGSCLISSEACKVNQIVSAQECGVSTVIVVDSSSTIGNKQKKFFSGVIDQMMEMKRENDKFALISVSESVDTVVDFTADRYEITKGYESVSYETENTHICEGIARAIDSVKALSDSSVKRVVVISDGYDEENDWQVANELLSELMLENYPVYTVECTVASKNKTSQVSLHQFSKQTLNEMGYCYSITKKEKEGTAENSVTQAVDYLEEIYDCVKVEVNVDKALMDGSKKPISLTLTLQDGGTISVDQEEVYLQMAEKEEAAKIVEVQQNKDLLFVSIVLGVLFVIVLIILVLVLLKKKKPEVELQEYDVSITGGYNIAENGSRMNDATRNFIGLEEEVEKTMIERPAISKKKQKSGKKKLHNMQDNVDSMVNQQYNTETYMPYNMGRPLMNNGISNHERNVRMTEGAPVGSFDMGGFADNESTVILDNMGGAQITKRLRIIDQMNNRIFEKEIVDEVIIGRTNVMHQSNFIAIEYDNSLSKQHCKVICMNGRYFIEDVGSMNHTFVRNTMVNGRVEIQSGEIIGIGQRMFKVEFL